MIVKDEAHVIARCLASVRPLITHWSIVDTGSTDGTQAVIQRVLGDLPGALHERPWCDFATNRNEALELARPHGDYVLIIDADDTLEYAPDFRMPALTHDSYELRILDLSIVFARIHLVRSALPWRWRGVLHEFIACEAPQRGGGTLPGVWMRRNHDGARRRSAQTYQRDAAVLEAALSAETDPFMRSRYTFYLAQSYRDCGQREKSIEMYLARAGMGFWDEEVFISLLSAGRLMRDVGRPLGATLAVLERASAVCPWRAEALHAAARLCGRRGRYADGYAIAKRGLGLSLPAGGLFVEPWIYEHGLLDEFAINAYWAGHYADSMDAWLRLLSGGKLPEAERGRVLANLRFAFEKLPREAKLGTLGKDSLTAQHALAEARPLRSHVRGAPRVLLAVLAKQKEASLPLYLECLDALDYPKSSMVLYVRTNNNTDRTEPILRAWVDRVGHLYAGVEFDASDVGTPVQQFGVNEWNPARFQVLGHIRNVSLSKVREHECDYYFVADVDNFIRHCTLRELVALDLPIAAPLLRSVQVGDCYSNYHAEVDANGYYQDCDQYWWILNRWVRGVIEVPVVHCTYLLRADILPHLTYQDGTSRHEYVVFSESARKAAIPQYIDNRQVYGYLSREETPEDLQAARALLTTELESTRAATESQAA